MNAGWWFGTMEFWMTFQKQLGMEQSSQLTNSMIFQRGRYTTNQTGNRMSKWIHLLFPAHNLSQSKKQFLEQMDHLFRAVAEWPGVAWGEYEQVEGGCQQSVSIKSHLSLAKQF